MEDFERTVEGFHKDANLKFAHEYEVKKKAILIYIYIYIYTTSEKPVNDQSYGVLDRYGIAILYK